MRRSAVERQGTPRRRRRADHRGRGDPRGDVRRHGLHLVWVGGLAEVWAPPFYAVGARGFTSGLINVWPERSVAIHAALEGGDHREAGRPIDGMRVFEAIRAEETGGANVSGVKAALALMGEGCGATRPPSAWPLDAGQGARLEASMRENALLGQTSTAGTRTSGHAGGVSGKHERPPDLSDGTSGQAP